jgi:hypothetical protein
MRQSESYRSSEHSADTPSLIYVCFCAKRFTTYSGIYLHLKSKHKSLFQKYKKLKISKLFKKAKDSTGAEIQLL